VIAFTVHGKAEPAGSKTTGVSNRGQRYVRDSNPASKEWKRLVSQVAGETMNGQPLLEGPLALTVEFFRPRPASHFGKRGLLPSAPVFPTTAPDATKLVRAVEDAMQGVVYRNDAQIVSQVARKQYGEAARCEVRVQEIGESMSIDQKEVA
jgi:Holliday junction resolvase RusA-like endonuclease